MRPMAVTGALARRPSRSIPARSRATGTGPEVGSATVWTLAVACVLVVAGYAAAGMAAVVSASHRADTAADLAALSALGGGCVRAGAVAAANGARLVGCAFDGGTGTTVDVRVEVRTRPLFGRSLVVRSRARAGYAALSP